MSFLCALVLLAAFAPSGITAPPTTVPPPADTGANIYHKVVRSTAWVHSDRGKGRVVTGSGSLVDKGRRLVLTNYHVVGDVKAVTVFFPVFNGKNPIPERKYYLDRWQQLGIPGEVVEIDKQADLALIRINRLPDGVSELPLAADTPDPGQAVHSIGNPGKSGALWVYTPGKVRQLYSKKWKAKLDERTVGTFEARVIETDSPTNPGDSGGPLVNDRGQLVGVTQGGAIDAQSISIFVDVREVKRLMNRRSVQLLRSDTPEPPPQDKPRRTNILESRDDGKFFSQTAWRKLAPAAEKLLQNKNTDMFVETVQSPWKGDVEKLKAMKPEEREKFFRELASERATEVSLRGVYILVCREPRFLYVHVPYPDLFPPGFGTQLKTAMLESFKSDKFDEGLQKAIDITLQARGLGEKK